MDALWQCYVAYFFWVRSLQGTPGEFLSAYVPIAGLITFSCMLARRSINRKRLDGEPQETAGLLLGLLWIICTIQIVTSFVCVAGSLLLPSFSYRVCVLVALPGLVATMLSAGAALDLLYMLYWQLEDSQRQSSGWRNVFRLLIFTLILVVTSTAGIFYGSVATNFDRFWIDGEQRERTR